MCPNLTGWKGYCSMTKHQNKPMVPCESIQVKKHLSMYLARKYYFSRKPRESLAFISLFYQDPWILILSQQSNPRPPSRQSSVVKNVVSSQKLLDVNDQKVLLICDTSRNLQFTRCYIRGVNNLRFASYQRENKRFSKGCQVVHLLK